MAPQQKAWYATAFPLAMEDASQSIMFSMVNMGVTPEDLAAAVEVKIDRVKQINDFVNGYSNCLRKIVTMTAAFG